MMQLPTKGVSPTIRLLMEADGDALIRYIESLSDASKATFQPHAFDASTLHAICQQRDPYVMRIIATTNETIVGYFVLQLTVSKNDEARLSSAGIETQRERIHAFAPSITDAYRGTGLADLLFDYTQEQSRLDNGTILTLLGGVLKENTRAIRYYEKKGFSVVGEFYRGDIANFTMIKR